MEIDQLKQMFEGIRDEKRMYANTATRIGDAFLALLSYVGSSSSSASRNYLRKDQEDTTSFLVTFEAGINIGEDIYNIDAAGNAILRSLKSGPFDPGKGEKGTFDLYVADDRSYLDIDNINIRESLNVKYLQIGNGLLKWDEENKAFYVEQLDGTPASFYATKGLSALGFNDISDTGTGSFDLLQDWDKYVDETAKSMALSAYLGKDLLDRITSLEKGQKGHKITISGSGNVVVNVEESSDGGTLTFTKGNIDLSGYATKTELEAVSKKTDSVTQRVDEFLGGSDTDGIINKWKELEAFLDGQQQGTTLSSLLDKKVDKTIQVKAGEGLSGGGALSGNVTLSLATVGTAGTYTKVTVDKYGRVTGHATLSASDIPTLEISKINGLQEELDKKLNISDFGNKFATEMANWFKKDTEGNVFVANSKGFYSESFVSAMGKSSGGSSSGGGSYDRLDNWADYSADRATWVLSAKLGYDLNTRVSSLESGSAINFETSGTGNALTGFSKSGNTVTFTKGTFLTEHQKLYTLTMQRNGEGVGSYVPTADKIININACTAINVPQGFTAGALSSVGVIALSFASGYSLPTTAKQQQWDTAYSFVESIAGSDANGVIDKWNEIISFLDGIGDSSTLEGLLNDINSNVTAVSSRVTKLEGYFVNGVAKEAAKTTGTLSINGKNFNGSASVNVGVIGVSYGGTGKSSVASGSMLYASAANTYAELATTEFGRNLLKANSGSVVSGLYAEAAYKLQNKRTIWGQAFDGTANISGAMYNVSAIVNETSNPYNHRLELGRTGVNQWDFYEYGGVFNFYRCQDSNGENKVILFKINNGSVGILTDTPTHTLHVNGTGYFSNTLSVASQIRIGNGTITWDSTKGCFHFSHGLYSDSFISAMGLNDSGSGGGSASYERLDNWTDYAEEKATWVLSAKLGNELNERLKSVEAGRATSVVTTGTGNVITAISKNGNTITATKGITALTSHQAIYSLTLQGNGTTIGTFNPKSANATINITAANIGAAAASHTHTLSALSDLKAGWSTLLKEDPKAYVTRWPAFSEVTSKPTTLAGYGITDAYTKTDADSRYVNVSGDTMTGSLNFANNIWNNVGDDAAIGDHNVAGHIGIKALNSANPGISFYNNSTTNVGKLTVNGTTLQWNTSTIWHAGNDGSGSGLDADLLDGFDSTYFVNFLGLSTQNWDSHYKGYILHFNSVEREGDNPYDLIGGNQATIIQVLPDNTVQYGAQLAIGFGSKRLAYRSRKVNSDGSYGWNSWDLISAGTLARPRTLWGQSFDGSANVSGDIHVSGNIYDTQIVQSVSGKYLDLKGSGLGFYTQNTIKAVIQPNGNFGIGTTAPSAKLHIVGDLFINTGDPTLKIYSGMINDTKSDGNICLQTNINTRDGETQEYPTQYPQRCNLVLQPRGGQVYVGMNPDGGDLRYKLLVNGKIKSVDEVVSTSAFRIAKGNYGVLMRNDGTSYYMLLTNSGQAEAGTWNSLRPFIVDLATGNVDLVQAGEHLSVSGDTQFNKSVSIGNGKIEWDEANKAFKFTGGIYSDSYISAMGLNAAGGSGGSYERLDSWSDYTEDKATWVLSALLGSNLNTRVSALEAGGATSVVTSGTGNVVTAVTKSGNVITATKGITALTSHQNIYALTLQGNGNTIGTFNPKTGNSTINITAANIGAAASSHTHNNYLPLTGGTMTGALKVPELRFTNGTAIWFDQYGNVTFGSTSSSNWWYIGSSSNSPSIAVNFGTGNVGIGQSASTTYKLAVNGDVHANSFTGSLNGNASTASKWQAARTVTMNGFADCSFSIDGSSNVSFDYKPYNFYLSVNNKNNYPWHRIAKIGPITAFYQDKEVTLLLSQGYDGGKWGIVRITLRTNSTGTVSTAHVEWLNRRAFNRTDVKIGLYNASGETYADVFLWTNGAYSSVTGLVLTQGGRGTLGRTWTLVNSSEVGNTTTTDKLTSTECWTSIEVAAEELHKKAYTNIIEADDAGGVGILYDHGKLTAISGTTMPNEGLRLYRAYNNGYPAAYGNLMSVRGENSGAGELLLEWKGSTELGHIYYRSKRDNTSSGWSSWGTLAFLTDNVASATKLQTARSINGTSFDGTENITTFKWGSSRNIYIRDASQSHTGEAVSVDGSSNEYLLLPKDVAFDQITINTKLISNGQTDFNKQWLKNVGGIWFGSADSSSVFASFDGDGTQTGLQSKVGTSIYFGWRGGTRAMTIDSAGNVVIGNTSTVNSAYKLDVKGDVRTQGDIVPYSNGQYNIGSSGARWSALFTQGIELYGFTPYIDFHFNNSSADYTSRIVEVVSGCLAINGTLAVLKSGNVGIGTTLPTEKLYVSGNIAATGAVTALVLSSSSDIRLKDIRKNVCLSVEEIAKAPAVEFAWKKTGDLAVGSIAQYWQPILPQAIHKRDNYLSMQYDVIALLASIANARRILSIEKKIKELEEEVKRLKIS